VHVSLGVIHAGTGQAQAALGDFDRALALDPASADALREKSLALDRLGRPAEAEAALVRAVELRPDYWGYHNALGAHYWRYGQYPEAEREFRRAIEIAPDNVRGLTNLGGLLNARGRPDEAVAVLQRAVAVQPTYAAISNLALVEFDRGRYAEAARAYEQAIALNDRDYRSWRNLGIARYWVPEQQARANEAFERAARLATERLLVEPDEAGVLADLADCQAHLGQHQRSRGSLHRALALAPKDVEVLATAASVYEQLGDRAAALEVLEKAVGAGYPTALVERDPGLALLRSDPRYHVPGKPAATRLPDRAKS
jgi:serine/threonine-protein kinase